MKRWGLSMVAAASLLPLATVAGCPDDGPRKIGASCTSDGQCASGLCAAGTCLDPDGDEDLDSLANRIEAALGTDPFAADSDGDGVDDPTELGDVGAPLDSDGDGKIDAIESASADADDDCIVDQQDPRDSVSDPPSEALPEACGDGTVVCTANPLAGTCAAALGTMVSECFQPFGDCLVTITGEADGSTSVTWSSGAQMIWKAAGDAAVGQLVGPSGATCGTLRSTDAGGDDPESTITVTGGPSFGIDGTEDATIITCPGGQQVVLHDSDADAFGQCSGMDSASRCEIRAPGSCLDEGDCPEGELCCAISRQPDAGRYCVDILECPYD